MKAITFAVLAGALVGFGVWLGSRTHDAPVTATSVTIPATRTQARTAPGLPSRLTPGLAIDLRDADAKVRRAAVAEVASSESRDPAVLLAASRDPNLDVAIAATEGLGALYRDGRITAAELGARISDHALAEKVRVTAINGLGLVTSRESAAVLADLAARGDATERRSAAILLVHQDPMAAVPALISALGDADEVVRDNARDSLRAFARGHDFGVDAAAWQRWWQSRAT